MLKFKFHIWSLKVQPFFWVFLFCALGTLALMMGWHILESATGDLAKSSEVIRNLILSLAAVVALPLIVWGRISAQKSADASHRSAQSALQTVQTKIFVDAVDQLGSKKSSTRIAAIYSFKELVEEVENKAFKTKVLNVLMSFFEEQLNEIWNDYNNNQFTAQGGHPDRDPDVIAARSVEFSSIIKIFLYAQKLGNKINPERTLNDISPSLDGIIMENQDLEGIDFFRTSLVATDFSDSNLHGANFRKVNLEHANLANTNLSHSVMDEAKLAGATLLCANLQGASFLNVKNIDKADFDCAQYNSKTKFPEGFDPKAYNMIKVAD